MQANESLPYQDFSNSLFDDFNSYISGAVSLIFNAILIVATIKIKTYTRPVKFSMCTLSVLRMMFSISIGLTVPSIIYSKSVSTLYIVKNGYSFPIPLGNALLAIFVAFIVMSCNLPAVQYLQVASLLSSSSRKELNWTISLIPIIIVIPVLFLLFFGYIPPPNGVHVSSQILGKIAEQGPASYLIITIRMHLDHGDETIRFETFSQICTAFVLLVILISLIVVIICYFYIRKQMKVRFSVSSISKKAQEQLNMVLALQFILPFTTINIPFFIIVILPFFGLAARVLADQALWFFSWCPAINPILMIVMVKNLREQLLPGCMTRKSWKNKNFSQAAKSSRMQVVSL